MIYENLKSAIYNCDSIKLMEDLVADGHANKFDAIITDPPYNISRQNNFNTMNRSGIDFGEWDKGFDLIGWIKNAVKLLVEGGNIVIFNDWKNMGIICQELENNGCDIKDMIRWTKTNPMPRNRDRRFITDYEVAVWAVKKGAKWTFNRISEKYERPEIVGPLTPASEKSLGAHSTQKPVYVMEWLLDRLTNEGDLVFDPFMGSGSTAIACINKKRKFYCSELDSKYYHIAESRISDAISKETNNEG